MNTYKQTIYTSVFVSIVSIAIGLILWSRGSGWCDFFSNVCVGIFCSSCIVIVTVYIQYKSELKRLFSNESNLLRKLYISLLFLSENDVDKMRVDMRMKLVDEIDNNLNELIHNASEISCIERKYNRDILNISKDIVDMYVPFIRDCRTYPGVALQMLKNSEYINSISKDIEIAAKSKSDKSLIHIFQKQEEN